MEEQRAALGGGRVRAEGFDPADHDQMVAAGVHGLDRAVDPGGNVRQPRRAGRGGGPVADPGELVAAADREPRQSSPCPAPRMLTQNTPARAIRGQVVDVRATMNVTSGGSRESEAKDWQAKPAGRPGSPGDVMTVTPLAKCPRTERNSAGSRGARSSSRTARSVGRGGAVAGDGAAAAVGAPTERRYRTAVAAIPACPIMALLNLMERQVGRGAKRAECAMRAVRAVRAVRGATRRCGFPVVPE